jgi:hypothetical protein
MQCQQIATKVNLKRSAPKYKVVNLSQSKPKEMTLVTVKKKKKGYNLRLSVNYSTHLKPEGNGMTYLKC